jgi:hypothetical protein
MGEVGAEFPLEKIDSGSAAKACPPRIDRDPTDDAEARPFNGGGIEWLNWAWTGLEVEGRLKVLALGWAGEKGVDEVCRCDAAVLKKTLDPGDGADEDGSRDESGVNAVDDSGDDWYELKPELESSDWYMLRTLLAENNSTIL